MNLDLHLPDPLPKTCVKYMRVKALTNRVDVLTNIFWRNSRSEEAGFDGTSLHQRVLLVLGANEGFRIVISLIIDVRDGNMANLTEN